MLHSYSFLLSYPSGLAFIYNIDGKENIKEVKVTYSRLSCTLAVVTSAVRGNIRAPVLVVDVRCSLYPDPSLDMTVSPLVSVSIL